jgi:uncharacterized membrane protein
VVSIDGARGDGRQQRGDEEAMRRSIRLIGIGRVLAYVGWFWDRINPA